MSEGVVDSHAHVWDLGVRDQGWIRDGSPIRRNFAVTDLQTAMASTPVTSVVLVQVINDEDETWDFVAHSREHEFIAGVVGWVDLAAPAAQDKLLDLMATGQLVGIRHQALAEVDPAQWLARPDVQCGLTVLTGLGLVFDLIVRPEHYDVAVEVARRNPSLQFVLNHLGKAPIASGQLEPWASQLRRLAAEPNIACKLSGLMTIADVSSWTYDDIRPFTDVAVAAFGPDRLLFGSDWPVSIQGASYQQVYEVAELTCCDLSQDERAKFLGGTARRLYRLKQPQ
jgi:L-fuconolactonase